MRKLALLVAMLMVAAAPALAQDGKGKGKGKGGKKDKATPETGGTLVDASVLGWAQARCRLVAVWWLAGSFDKRRQKGKSRASSGELDGIAAEKRGPGRIQAHSWHIPASLRCMRLSSPVRST